MASSLFKAATSFIPPHSQRLGFSIHAAVRPYVLGCLNPRRGVATMLVNGKSEPAVISVHDQTFIRGDGAFDVVSLEVSPSDSSVGVPVGTQLHLDRLKATCSNLRLPMEQDLSTIEKWIHAIGKSHGPGSCRIIVTRGGASEEADPKTIMLHYPPAQYPDQFRLVTMSAPWHMGYAMPVAEKPMAYSESVDADAWHTVKWMSYAPNCLVTTIAKEKGGDEALLLASDGRVLDGPNFASGFVIDGKIRLIAPMANHMLPSCTQAMTVAAAEAAGLPFSEDVVHIDEVRRATSVFAMSATRHLKLATAIDGKPLPEDDSLFSKLHEAYWSLVRAEVRATVGE